MAVNFLVTVTQPSKTWTASCPGLAFFGTVKSVVKLPLSSKLTSFLEPMPVLHDTLTKFLHAPKPLP